MNPFERIAMGRPATTPESEEIDDFLAFGMLRGIRDRAVMLELRLRDGTILGLHYSWLERAEFDPSTGITLTFGGHTVTITGRNLNGCGDAEPQVRMFSSILRHRVAWIREGTRADGFTVEKGATFVERITCV